MSELFLDTPADCIFISQILAPLPFSSNQLDHMFKKQVAPVLYTNLHTTAGIYGAFDLNWFIDKIKKNEKKTLTRLITEFIHDNIWSWRISLVKEDWSKVLNHIQKIRKK